MNKRLMSVLAFAFIISAGASLLLYRLIASRVAPTTATAATAKVIVAARTLEVGTLIKDIDVKSGDWSGTIPPQFTTKVEDVVGRGVVATIYAGEPVVSSRLAAKGSGAGLAATIPQGMRAVAVRVNEVVGVAGFVVPGMRVDILIAGLPPGVPGNMGTVAKTLLQNVEVLSAGQNIQKDNEGKPIQVQVVNLLVTPEDAEILSLASNETRIQLVLRNPLDTEVAKTPGTAIAKLFAGTQFTAPAPSKPVVVRKVVAPAPVAQVKPPAPPPPVTVEVIQGTKRTESKFQDNAEVKK
jgi:pilus assembly protein CpaB